MKTKVIITKDIIEVYSYEKLNTRPPKEGIQEGIGIYKEQNYLKTQRSRRNKIRQLVANNFESSDLFLTLTFNNKNKLDINNPKETNKLFNLFIKRLRYKYPKIIGLAVIEFQNRGAVHYHVILKGIKFIPNKELQEIWSYGFVKVNSIDKVDNVGAYVIKYMNKDLDDKRLMGCKAYLKVGKLTDPIELCSWKHLDLEELRKIDILLNKKSPTYNASYVSEMAGTIAYSQYNLTRN